LYGKENWLLALKKERRMKMFVYKMLKRVFGSKREPRRGKWREWHN
jgi:hypothetical protein